MNKNLQTFSSWIDFRLNKSLIELKILQLNNQSIEMFIIRDDLIHPIASGNKLRKLKYNIIQACIEDCKGLISYGGAFSNHILAVSAVCNELEIPLKLFIRGDELNRESNGILKKCFELGAELHFTSRSDYSRKKKTSGKNTIDGEAHWFIPEGGANSFGVEGCKEISRYLKNNDRIVISVGTATTLYGIYSSTHASTRFFTSTISKNFNISKQIKNLFQAQVDMNRITEMNDMEQLRFGKISPQIMEFVNSFNNLNNFIKIEPIYTGKTMYDLMNQNNVQNDSNSRLVFIHTGGLNNSLWKN
jgi:1-aminocyclopropane-1-carboxylate deaminase